jgi:hypothetical protein
MNKCVYHVERIAIRKQLCKQSHVVVVANHLALDGRTNQSGQSRVEQQQDTHTGAVWSCESATAKRAIFSVQVVRDVEHQVLG